LAVVLSKKQNGIVETIESANSDDKSETLWRY